MTDKLPINLEDLLRQRRVEGERIEYKAGWNPDATIRTLCAFANDFENLGGGYVVIGQDCGDAGRPVFPPKGLRDNQLDRIQRELLQGCNLIQPLYFPMLSVERFEDRNLIVLWAPGGQNRPYKAPRAVTARKKEGRSTGIRKILKAMAANGSPPPEFETDEDRSYFLIRLPIHAQAAREDTPEVTPRLGTKSGLSRDQVEILEKCSKAATLVDLLTVAGRSNRTKFRDQVLRPMLDACLIEMTIPDKPRSSKQRYRLTDKGRQWLKEGGKAP